MRLIEVKQSGKGIKQGDVVEYDGNYYLATDEADLDGDVYVVDADQDTKYINERHITKVASAGEEFEQPVVTVEMTVDELKVLVAATGAVTHDQVTKELRENGEPVTLSRYGSGNYGTLFNILKKVAK